MKAITIAAVLGRMRPQLQEEHNGRGCTMQENRGEIGWGLLSLVLFLVLGPFSVIAVLPGLWRLAQGHEARNASEPAPSL